jgi:hypothetical protein
MPTPTFQDIGGSARIFRAVTPSDTTDLPFATIGLRIAGAGNVAVHDASGNATTITGVLAGETLPIVAVRVLATGTTATGIIAYG